MAELILKEKNEGKTMEDAVNHFGVAGSQVYTVGVLGSQALQVAVVSSSSGASIATGRVTRR